MVLRVARLWAKVWPVRTSLTSSWIKKLGVAATAGATIVALTACQSSSSADPAVPTDCATVGSTEVPEPVIVDGVTVTGALSSAPEVTVSEPAAVPDELVTVDIAVGCGAEAMAGSTVTTQYAGYLLEGGTEFDSSWSRGAPATFPLANVIPGWQEGIPGMKEGGRRLLIIPSALAYGPAGAPPAIPPNAPLVFVVDLDGVGS